MTAQYSAYIVWTAYGKSLKMMTARKKRTRAAGANVAAAADAALGVCRVSPSIYLLFGAVIIFFHFEISHFEAHFFSCHFCFLLFPLPRPSRHFFLLPRSFGYSRRGFPTLPSQKKAPFGLPNEASGGGRRCGGEAISEPLEPRSIYI